MKVVVATFNQEKALLVVFSVIVKTDCGTDGLFYSTTPASTVAHLQEASRINTVCSEACTSVSTEARNSAR